MFWRSWLGALLAVALVLAARFWGNGLAEILLIAAGVLVTVLGSLWVHLAHNRSLASVRAGADVPGSQAAESAIKSSPADTVAAALMAPAMSPISPLLVDRVTRLANDAGAELNQVQELWTLVGRVNDLLTNVHDATSNQLPDLDRARDVAREVVRVAADMTEAVRQAREGAAERKAAAMGVQQAILDITRGMDAIRQAVDGAGERILELAKNSSKIGEIVRMIRAIAEQTNMLALNAAIEAARAGSAGRGFAVVADEVRKLADRSRQATKQIEDLVTNIREGTDSATKAMDAGQSEVSHGVAVVTGAEGAITEILRSAESLDLMVEDFGQRAEATSASMAEVMNAVEEVTRLAHQNNATMKELAEADWFSNAIKRAEALAEGLIAAARETNAEVIRNK